VIPTLQAEGYEVIAAQLCLDSQVADVAAAKRTLGRVSSPAILSATLMAVPSSPLLEPMIALSGWFTSPRSLPMLMKPCRASSTSTPHQSSGHIEVADGRVWMLPEGAKDFAGDLPEEEQKVVWATHFASDADLFNQKVDGTAWKSKPSWSIVATEDRTVHPDLERFLAKRMGATTVAVKSSHVAMLSQPQLVIDVIRKAARAALAKVAA